jgi:hypothetical protein
MRYLRPALFVAFILPAALVVPARAVPQSEPPPQQAPQGSPTSNQQSPAASDDKLCTIAGNVRSANTGEPLRRAHIELTLHDTEDPIPFRALSDAAGHFSVERVPAGGYDMIVMRDGYRSSRYGQRSPSQNGAVMTLEPGQKMTDLLFRLSKLAVVSGRIVDLDGDPVQGANVAVMAAKIDRSKGENQPEFGQLSDDRGEYRIFDVLPGRYIIFAGPPDSRGPERPGHEAPQEFQRVYYPAAADRARASVIEVKSGDEITGMDMTLLPKSNGHLYKIHGQVVNNTGATGEHWIYVVLVPRGSPVFGFGDQKVAQAESKGGAFEFDDVAPGDYGAAAFYQTQGQRYQSAQNVTVAESDLDNVTLVISKGADIAARVVYEGKAAQSAAGDMSAALENRDTEGGSYFRDSWTAQVQQDKSYAWAGVTDGSYQVEVRSPCQECYVKAADANGIDVLARGVTVSDGAGPQRIDIVVSSETGSLTGTVTNKDDLPAAGATVVLVPSSQIRIQRHEYKTAPTDQYGRFEVKGLPPGEYTAYAFEKADYDVFTDAEPMHAYTGKGESVSVSANGRQSVELKMIPENDAAN